MFFRKKKEVNQVEIHLSQVLERYEGCADPVAATHSFIKELFDPKPERYDITYRYEHSLRVGYWGRRIAEGEGWESAPLIMACLLHDVGYLKCRSLEECGRHPAYSAEIAEEFLKRIKYDEEISKNICQAIAIHDRWNDVPEGATPFELSVRDADDLDRFDVLRMCLFGKDDIGEHSAAEVIDRCDKRLTRLEEDCERICGTQTAKSFWEAELQVRKQFFEGLKRQMESTFLYEY